MTPASRDEVRFIDLDAQQRVIRDNVERRLRAVLDHGRYIAGPEVDEVEAALGTYAGVPEVVTCSSGTDALVIPMMALGLGLNDAVFVPSVTYNATANAVLLAGARPVFVDVGLDTMTMCPADLARAIAEAEAGGLTPRAVIAVDLFGCPADYPALRAAAPGLTMIGDAAQSFGGEQGGRRVGALADVTATSFFPGKALGAYGDGGAIFTDDAGLAEACRSIRWHGTGPDRAASLRVGFNGRFDTMQAAVLLEKLTIFPGELERRRGIAAAYHDRLGDIAHPQRPPADTRSGHGYHTVRVADRDAVRGRMTERGIPTAAYYATPLHEMPAFVDHAPAAELPNTAAASRELLSLPMHPYLSDEHVDTVCDALRAAVAG